MSEKDNKEKEAGKELTFLEHLEELRIRLIKAIAALFIGFILTYFVSSYLIEFLIRPFETFSDSHLTLLAPTEGFLVKLKTSFLAGLVISSPVIFYQFWKFLAPGLYENEKKFIFPVVTWSVVLFITGGAFAYQILPFAMRFFQSFAMENVENFWSLSRYVTFVTYLLLAFGAVFELPLILYYAARMGLVTPDFLRKKRKVAIVILLVLAAIITPPDVFTQVVLALPLVILYEISILLSAAASRKYLKSSKSKGES